MCSEEEEGGVHNVRMCTNGVIGVGVENKIPVKEEGLCRAVAFHLSMAGIRTNPAPMAIEQEFIKHNLFGVRLPAASS